MPEYEPNENIKLSFIHLDGTAGLGDSDFTKQVLKNGADASGSITVTVTESDVSGIYYMSVTPNASGDWLVYVYETSAPENAWYFDLRVESAASYPSAASIADAVWDETSEDHTTVGSFGHRLKQLVAYVRNKVTKTPTSPGAFDGTYSVKDFDGTSEFESGSYDETPGQDQDRTPD